MKFLFIYIGGSIPESKRAGWEKDWNNWASKLKGTGIRVMGGKVLSSNGILDYHGDLRGISIVEAESLDDAVEKAKGCPSLPYGTRVEVLQEWSTEKLKSEGYQR